MPENRKTINNHASSINFQWKISVANCVQFYDLKKKKEWDGMVTKYNNNKEKKSFMSSVVKLILNIDLNNSLLKGL